MVKIAELVFLEVCNKGALVFLEHHFLEELSDAKHIDQLDDVEFFCKHLRGLFVSLEFLCPTLEPGLVLKTAPEEKTEVKCHAALQIAILIFAASSQCLNHLFLGLTFVACFLS